jgi:PAS domain S-box-containing protein
MIGTENVCDGGWGSRVKTKRSRAGRLRAGRSGGGQVEARLEEIEAHGRKLVDALPVGFIIVDPASVLTYVNQHFLDLLGYARGELIGRPLADLLCPINRAVLAQLEDAVRNGRNSLIEVPLFRKTGACMWVQLSFVPPLSDDIASLGVCVVVTNIVDLIRNEVELRRSNDELRALSAKIVNVQEGERQRIAADLHDSLGQSIAVVKFGLEQTLGLLRSGTADAAIPLLETLLVRLKEAAGEVRRVAMNVRPSLLDDLGLGAALCWLFREFEMVYTSIAVRRQMDFKESDISKEQQLALYRIVQEAMNNAAKHAHATAVDVSLRRIGDQLELVIRDNGRGFDPDDVTARLGRNRGLGLASIRDRAIFAGGTHALRTGVGQGVEIRVCLPLASCAPETVRCATGGDWPGSAVAALPDENPLNAESEGSG